MNTNNVKQSICYFFATLQPHKQHLKQAAHIGDAERTQCIECVFLKA